MGAHYIPGFTVSVRKVITMNDNYVLMFTNAIELFVLKKVALDNVFMYTELITQIQ